MDSVEAKLPAYLASETGNVLGVGSSREIRVFKIGGGDYNLNYRATFPDGRNFLVRLNVEPQSGLQNQIEYEYRTLQFLAPLVITPKPIFLDASKKHFPYGLLIEEFIEGQPLLFSVEALRRAAHTLATLHTAPVPPAENFMCWGNPLREQLTGTVNALRLYEKRETANQEIVALGAKIIAKAEGELALHESEFVPRSLTHTDTVPSNFLDTGSRVYLVDWEKARLDDPSYDITVLFAPLSNLWDSPRVLTTEEKETFLKTYSEETGDRTIYDRVLKRLPLFTLRGTLWAAGRVCDVEEGSISEELGAQNYERYKKIIDLDELKKFI